MKVNSTTFMTVGQHPASLLPTMPGMSTEVTSLASTDLTMPGINTEITLLALTGLQYQYAERCAILLYHKLNPSSKSFKFIYETHRILYTYSVRYLI